MVKKVSDDEFRSAALKLAQDIPDYIDLPSALWGAATVVENINREVDS